MDDSVAQFTGITGSSPATAQQFLELSDGNLERAIQLFFDSGGMDLDGQPPANTSSATADSPQAPPPPSLHPQHDAPLTAGRVDPEGLVHLDSDEEISDDNDPDITGWKRRDQPQVPRGGSSVTRTPTPRSVQYADRDVEDDEAFARRMQEELYAGGDSGGRGGGGAGLDADGVRAPIARTTETLVGPGADLDMPMDMRSAIEAQLASRRTRAPGRPGIFNQRAAAASVWDDEPVESSSRRQVLAQATGGASEASSKASLLAEMYRPPHEIMSRLSWDEARREGKDNEKWILVNVQDPSIFDCQVLNRDIWKNPEIKETVKENFIFIQYNKDDARAGQYIQFYFKDEANQDAYPHIAIVDPRTGEQVKVWSGPPVPKPMDYLMQLHEFLDRYSLKANAKNPVATRKPEKKATVDVGRMTEEEMLEMALQNSLGNGGGQSHHDPDALTRSVAEENKGKGRAEAVIDEDVVEASPRVTNGSGASNSTSPFSNVSSSNPHVEPAADPNTVTRIQFRHAGGRIIRRFALADPVLRLYEWLKAEPLEGKEGMEFGLVCMGKNLMEHVHETIEQAGLRNQTVMIEFVED